MMLCRKAIVVLAGACLVWVAGVPALAQPLKPPMPPTPQDSNDSAKKDALLKSSEWQETMRNLDEWFSVQKLYDAQEVKTLREKMSAKIAAMNAEQLVDFYIDLRQRLVILNGQEARDARRWLGETLAVAAPAYAKQVLAKLPDVARLTASQLQEQLDEFEDRQAQTIRSSAAFERGREERARTVQRQQQEADAERQRALDRAAADAANSSPIINNSRERRFPVNPGGGGFGFGFGYPILYGGYRW